MSAPSIVLAGAGPDGADEATSLGQVAEKVENEAIDLEYLAYDIKSTQIELARGDIGAQFVSKKDEILTEWAEHQKEWEYLDEDVKEIRPQMDALDDKLTTMRKYFLEQTKPTSEKIEARNTLLEESNEQLDSVLTQADEVCEAQKKLKGSKSNFLDQRRCLFVIMALLACLSIIILMGLFNKVGIL